jgi:hypothetical protein
VSEREEGRERERERGGLVMTMDREKEREIELESAMYTNCLLLGLDPAVIGVGGSNGVPRVGLFRHSNPKLGEQLLYFILSSLRGPIQSAKVPFCPSHLYIHVYYTYICVRACV